jgi:hypothetical protein
MRPRLVLLAVALLCAAVAVLVATAGREVGTSPAVAQAALPKPEPKPEGLTHFRFFSPHSFWNRGVAPRAEVDPTSALLVGALAERAAAEIAEGKGPYITTSPYSIPIYRVPSTQPTERVELVGHPEAPALQAAWEAVPMPPTATAAAGTDGHMVVWQPSTDRLWEFWRLKGGPGGWRASWGGAMEKVSENPGVYNRRAWPGSQPWWGGSSSSLSIAGGVITFDDLRHGEINHALAMSVPNTKAGVYALPARRTDGKTEEPTALPEGMQFQLNPRLDLSKLRMPPLTRMIAKAAQKYGIFLKAGAGDITFYAQDPTPTGTEPYRGTGGFYGGRTPIELLSHFPWHHLRVIKMKLRPAKQR